MNNLIAKYSPHITTAVLSLLVALLFWGCGSQAVPTEDGCDGELVQLDEAQYCVYEMPITETGFDCPSYFQYKFEFDDIVVCGSVSEMPFEHEEIFEYQWPLYEPTNQSPGDSEYPEYNKITGVEGLLSPVSLCEFPSTLDVAGTFYVSRIYAIPRDIDEDNFGIYIELDLLDPWYGSPADKVEFRVNGGPQEDAFMTPPISLKRGEEAVFFLNYPDETDRYEFGTAMELFRADDEGMLRNGYHFTDDGISPEALRELILEIHEADEGECPIDRAVGEECRSDSSCAGNSYCEMPVGECSETGQCRPVGDCERYDCDGFCQVCGCDEITYPNDCEAIQAGVSIAYHGPCDGAHCTEDFQCQVDSYPVDSSNRYCDEDEGVCRTAEQ